MTGADVKRIRLALEAAAGGRLSQRGLGLLLGLADKSAAGSVRQWEDGSRAPSGPAATALTLMADILQSRDQALRDGLLARVRTHLLG